MNSRPQVGFVGLSKMSRPMTERLLSAQYTVDVFNRSRGPVDALAQHGATPADSARQVAERAEVVLTALPTPESVQSVYAEMAEVARSGQVYLDHATVSPGLNRWCAEQLSPKRAEFLDAPISGGAARAAEGALTMLVSGKPAAIDKAKPALDVMSAKLYLLGYEAGIGASFKIVNQLLAGVHIAAASEAIVFAKRLGLDIAKVYEVITASAGNSWMFENRMPHVLDGDYSPKSAVEIFTKDLGIIADISRSEKFATPIASSALQMFLMTAAAGMGKDDDASVARLYAMIAGLDLPGAPASTDKATASTDKD